MASGKLLNSFNGITLACIDDMSGSKTLRPPELVLRDVHANDGSRVCQSGSLNDTHAYPATAKDGDAAAGVNFGGIQCCPNARHNAASDQACRGSWNVPRYRNGLFRRYDGVRAECPQSQGGS